MEMPVETPVEMHRAAVFLDRDGVINEQMGYVNHESRFVLLPGVGQAIARLNAAGFAVVVVTNQSGLARGYFPPELLQAVHEKMRRELLASSGARLDGVYVCPHLKDAKVAEFRADCDCRKPKTGLLTRAARELGLNLSRSFMVGDRLVDVRCGKCAGTKTVLVRTGYGRGEEQYLAPQEPSLPDCVADDLPAAVEWIVQQAG